MQRSMRWLPRVLIIVAALALPSTAAAQASGSVLIWGGGKTPADGEKAMADVERHRAALAKEQIALPEGYPRQVVSDDHPGLNPGFHIAIVGFCENEATPRVLKQLRRVYPHVYARKVNERVDVKACPSFAWPSDVPWDGPVLLNGIRDLRNASCAIATATPDSAKAERARVAQKLVEPLVHWPGGATAGPKPWKLPLPRCEEAELSPLLASREPVEEAPNVGVCYQGLPPLYEAETGARWRFGKADLVLRRATLAGARRVDFPLVPEELPATRCWPRRGREVERCEEKLEAAEESCRARCARESDEMPEPEPQEPDEIEYEVWLRSPEYHRDNCQQNCARDREDDACERLACFEAKAGSAVTLQWRRAGSGFVELRLRRGDEKKAGPWLRFPASTKGLGSPVAAFVGGRIPLRLLWLDQELAPAKRYARAWLQMLRLEESQLQVIPGKSTVVGSWRLLEGQMPFDCAAGLP